MDDDLAFQSEISSDGSISILVPQRNAHIHFSDSPPFMCFR